MSVFQSILFTWSSARRESTFVAYSADSTVHRQRHHQKRFPRRRIFGPSLSKVILANVALLIAQINDVYSWSVSSFLITGSHASIENTETVALGTQKGLNECARQFAYERWSCPESIFSTNIFRNNLPINREIAFVQAIISAGLMHTVTKSCSSGETQNCKCSTTTQTTRDVGARESFRWGGCSDDIELGSRLAMSYLEDQEGGHDFKALIRRHNNEAGHNAIKETMIQKCKCHGVSGACSTKTCWMKISEFHDVGNYLKKAYQKAVKIESNEKNQLSVDKSLASIPKWKLAYLQESPDYCSARNATIGSTGTLGRRCSKRKGKHIPSEERNSCRRLCKMCGYTAKPQKRIVNSSCNCKFNFCCEVQCETCSHEEITWECVA